MENACDWVTGGTKYHQFMVNGGGLATVVDSLYAIEQLVFVQKQLTLPQSWQKFCAMTLPGRSCCCGACKIK